MEYVIGVVLTAIVIVWVLYASKVIKTRLIPIWGTAILVLVAVFTIIVSIQKPNRSYSGDEIRRKYERYQLNITSGELFAILSSQKYEEKQLENNTVIKIYPDNCLQNYIPEGYTVKEITQINDIVYIDCDIPQIGSTVFGYKVDGKVGQTIVDKATNDIIDISPDGIKIYYGGENEKIKVIQ